MTRPIYRSPDGRPLQSPRKQRVRAEVIGRDKGICRECTMDVGALLGAIRVFRKLGAYVPTVQHLDDPRGEHLPQRRFDFTRPLFVVDHVKPLADGGDDDPDNAVFICQACDRGKTRDDAKRRARKRPKPSWKKKRGLCEGVGRRSRKVFRGMEGDDRMCGVCGEHVPWKDGKPLLTVPPHKAQKVAA